MTTKVPTIHAKIGKGGVSVMPINGKAPEKAGGHVVVKTPGWNAWTPMKVLEITRDGNLTIYKLERDLSVYIN